MRFECRICVLRLAFHVFIQIRYEHSHQKTETCWVSQLLRFFFIYLAKSLEISRFCDIDYRHILPYLPGRMCLFFSNDDMLDHICLF